MSTSEIVVVLSGGLDSATVLFKYINEGKKVSAIYLDYGKSCSRREIKAVKLLCHSTGTQLELIDLTSLGKIQRDYAALGDGDADELDCSIILKGSVVPCARSDKQYVSGFHTVLSTAAYYAQVTDVAYIAIGAIKEQFDNIKGLGNVFKLFSDSVSTLNAHIGTLTVLTPLNSMSKTDVAIEAKKLGVPIEKTWSCLHGGDIHCGECTQCVERKAAIGKGDPTIYAK